MSDSLLGKKRETKDTKEDDVRLKLIYRNYLLLTEVKRIKKKLYQHVIRRRTKILKIMKIQ